MSTVHRDTTEEGRVIAHDPPSRLQSLPGRADRRIGRFIATLIVGVAIVVAVAFVLNQRQSDSIPETPAQTRGQAAEAARWTALAESLSTGGGLTRGQAAEVARWTALAEALQREPSE